MIEKRNKEFKFIFFFFILSLIFLKQVFAYGFEDYQLKLQSLINHSFTLSNFLYTICYVIILVVLFYFIWKVVSISPFSGYVSFILSVGLVLILAFMRIIGRISTIFFNIFKYFIDKGLIYTVLFLVFILIILLAAKYIFGWILYYTKGSKEKRKKQKEELEKAELKGVIQGIRGKGKSFIQKWLEKLGIHK